MDAFFAAVEVLDRPELAGRPLLIGSLSPRSVVTTASYEARRFGVGSAMPMELARRRCPQALVIPPRFERYRELSLNVMEVFRSFSPLVEPLSLDEAFLDLSGTAARFEGATATAIGAKIKASVYEATGLRVSVGVSTTKFVAKVASDHRKPDGLTVVPEAAVRSFLGPLPVRKLWGVGPKTEERLLSLGLRTIDDVAAASPGRLQALLGSAGPQLHRLAHGDDPREVVPDREIKSVGSEETLERDVLGSAAIRPWLLRASEQVASRLRRRRLLGRGIRVKLKTASFQLMSRQRTLRLPTDDPREIFGIALQLLAEFPMEEPIRLVGVTAYELEEVGSIPAQGELFDPPTPTFPRDRAIERAVDDVRQRFGEGAIRRADEG